MKNQFKHHILINDLPIECYVVQPMYQGQLESYMEVPVILVKRDHQGYWPTSERVCNIDELMELNEKDFGVDSIDIVAVMQDQSISGHFGILDYYNEKVKECPNCPCRRVA